MSKSITVNLNNATYELVDGAGLLCTHEDTEQVTEDSGFGYITSYLVCLNPDCNDPESLELR